MLFNIIYISRATEAMGQEQLLSLLERSRMNNEKSGITGMLLYRNGEFMQALEGEREVLEELIGRIEKDPRHRDLLVLTRKEIPVAHFADWSMGFSDISGECPEGLVDPDSFFSESNSFRQGNTAWNFLKNFYRS
jgi:hypothetical protein